MVTDHRLLNTCNSNDNSKPLTKDDFITKLHTADVLLGRGSPTINYVGNVAFRLLIKQRKAEYGASGQHKTKDRVAREIFALIQDKGGRFLRRIDTIELEQLGPLSSTNQKVWVAVYDDVALEKVKQALRDKEQFKYRSRAKEAMMMEQQQQQQQQSQQQLLLSNKLLFGADNNNQQNNNTTTNSSSMMALQHGLLQLHHLMDRQKTSDMMVLAHLQQQMQRKQLIHDLTWDQRAATMMAAPNAGAEDFTSHHDLNALLQLQQQLRQQQQQHAVVPTDATGAAASGLFLYP
jgi:site-specific DNA-cytosine methylase